MQYPNINPEIINIYGPFSLRWYSLAYIIGFIFCSFFLKRELKHKLQLTDVESITNYSIFGVVIGARLGHVLFYDPIFYFTHLIDILKVWEGGLSFHGGIVGLMLAILLFVKKFNSGLLKNLKNKYSNEVTIEAIFQERKISFTDICDVISIYVPFGIIFGRTANFINGELYGNPTNLSIGMIFPKDPLQVSRHPVQLYEAFFEGFILFLIMIILRKKTNLLEKKSYFSFLFIVLYSLFRFFLEFFKEATETSGYFFKYFTMGQVLCALSIVMVMAFFWIRKIRNQKKL